MLRIAIITLYTTIGLAKPGYYANKDDILNNHLPKSEQSLNTVDNIDTFDNGIGAFSTDLLSYWESYKAKYRKSYGSDEEKRLVLPIIVLLNDIVS